MTFCRLILSLSLSLSPVAADTVIAAAAEDLVKLGVDREAAVHLLDSWVAVAGPRRRTASCRPSPAPCVFKPLWI